MQRKFRQSQFEQNDDYDFYNNQNSPQDKQSSELTQAKKQNQFKIKLQQTILKRRKRLNDTIVVDFAQHPYLSTKVNIDDLLEQEERLERLQQEKKRNQVLQIRNNLSIFSPINDNQFDNLLHVEYALFMLKKTQKPNFKIYELKDTQWRKLSETRQVAREMMVNFQNMKSGFVKDDYHYLDQNLVDLFQQRFLKISIMMIISRLIIKFVKKKYPKQKLKWITKPKKKFVYFYVAKSLVYAKQQYSLEVADIFYRVLNLIFKIQFPQPVTYMEMLILFLEIQYKYSRTVDQILDRKNQIYFPQKKCEGFLVQYVPFNPKSSIYDLNKAETSEKNLTIYYYDVKGQKRWTPKFQTIAIKMYLKVQSFSGLKDIMKQKYEWKDHNQGDFSLIKIKTNMQAIFRVAMCFCQLQFNALIFQLKLQNQLNENQKRFLLVTPTEKQFIAKRQNAVITRKLIFDYYINHSVHQEYYEVKLMKATGQQEEQFIRHKYNYLSLIVQSCVQFLKTIEHLPTVQRNRKAEQQRYKAVKGKTKGIEDFFLTKLDKLYYNQPITKVYYQYDEGTDQFRNIIEYYPLELALNAVNTKLESKLQDFVWDQSADRLLMRMFIQHKNANVAIKQLNNLLKRKYQVKEKQLQYTLDRSSRLCYGFVKFQLSRLLMEVFKIKQVCYSIKKFLQMNTNEKSVIYNRYEAGHVRLLMYDYYLNNYNRKKVGTIEQEKYRFSYLTYIADGVIEMLLRKVYLHKILMQNYTEVKDKKYKTCHIKGLKDSQTTLAQCLKQQQNNATVYQLKYESKLQSLSGSSVKIGQSKMLKQEYDNEGKLVYTQKKYSYESFREQNKFNYESEKMFQVGWVPEPEQRPEFIQIQQSSPSQKQQQQKQNIKEKLNKKSQKRLRMTGQYLMKGYKKRKVNENQESKKLNSHKNQDDDEQFDIKVHNDDKQSFNGQINKRVTRSLINSKNKFSSSVQNSQPLQALNQSGTKLKNRLQQSDQYQYQFYNSLDADNEKVKQRNVQQVQQQKINSLLFKELKNIQKQSSQILKQQKRLSKPQQGDTIGQKGQLLKEIYSKYDHQDKKILLTIKKYLNNKKLKYKQPNNNIQDNVEDPYLSQNQLYLPQATREEQIFPQPIYQDGNNYQGNIQQNNELDGYSSHYQAYQAYQGNQYLQYDNCEAQYHYGQAQVHDLQYQQPYVFDFYQPSVTNQTYNQLPVIEQEFSDGSLSQRQQKININSNYSNKNLQQLQYQNASQQGQHQSLIQTQNQFHYGSLENNQNCLNQPIVQSSLENNQNYMNQSIAQPSQQQNLNPHVQDQNHQSQNNLKQQQQFNDPNQSESEYSSLPLQDDKQLQQINQYSEGHINRQEQPYEEKMTLDQLIQEMKLNKKIKNKNRKNHSSSEDDSSNQQQQNKSDGFQNSLENQNQNEYNQSNQNQSNNSENQQEQSDLKNSEQQSNNNFDDSSSKSNKQRKLKKKSSKINKLKKQKIIKNKKYKSIKQTKIQKTNKSFSSKSIKQPHQLQVDQWQFTNMRNRGRKRGVKLSQMKRKKQVRIRKNSSSSQSQNINEKQITDQKQDQKKLSLQQSFHISQKENHSELIKLEQMIDRQSYDQQSFYQQSSFEPNLRFDQLGLLDQGQNSTELNLNKRNNAQSCNQEKQEWNFQEKQVKKESLVEGEYIDLKDSQLKKNEDESSLSSEQQKNFNIRKQNSMDRQKNDSQSSDSQDRINQVLSLSDSQQSSSDSD